MRAPPWNAMYSVRAVVVPLVIIDTCRHIVHLSLFLSSNFDMLSSISLVPSRYGASVGNPLLPGLVCSGTELHLLRCPRSDWNGNETGCSRQQGASISCCKSGPGWLGVGEVPPSAGGIVSHWRCPQGQSSPERNLT